MKTVFTILLAFVSCILQGQVPGYLGKRLTVFAEINPMPAVLVQNTNNALVFTVGDDSFLGKKNAFAFNVRPQLEIDYLLSRDFSVGMIGGYLMTGTTRAYDGPDVPGMNPRYLDAAAVKGYSAGVRMKFFRFKKSSTIAPIGLYKTVSLVLNRANSYDDFSTRTSLLAKDVQVPVVSFGLGRQSIIARSLLLKTGFELGLPMVPLNFLNESSGEWTSDEYTRYHLHRSLAGYNLICFNVAIGYIPL
jgi:hypothetical protein